MDTITKEILIEDLVDNYPFSVEYLSKKGIRCIRCGEPIWGTLEESAIEKGFDTQTIDNFINELNNLSNKFEEEVKTNINKIDISKL